MGSMAEPSAISQRDLLNIEIHDGHPVLLGARLVPPRGPNRVSKKWALRLCLRDRRHKGRHAGFGPEPLVHVYVPTSPNPTSGYFLLVPEREVTAINISVEEAMKLIVSGGLYSPSPSLGAADPEARWGGTVKQPEAGVPIG